MLVKSKTIQISDIPVKVTKIISDFLLEKYGTVSLNLETRANFGTS